MAQLQCGKRRQADRGLGAQSSKQEPFPLNLLNFAGEARVVPTVDLSAANLRLHRAEVQQIAGYVSAERIGPDTREQYRNAARIGKPGQCGRSFREALPRGGGQLAEEIILVVEYN